MVQNGQERNTSTSVPNYTLQATPGLAFLFFVARWPGAPELDVMPIKSFRIRLALSGSAVLVIGIGALLAYWPKDAGPLYQGKPLTYWSHQLPVTIILAGSGGTNGVLRFNEINSAGRKYGASVESTNAAVEAIRHFGTNGLPYFLSKLRGDSSQLELLAEKVGSEHRIPWLLPRDSANMERAQAVTALVALSPLPERWVEQVRKVSRNSNRRVAASAGYVLSRNKTAHDTNQQDWHFKILHDDGA